MRVLLTLLFASQTTEFSFRLPAPRAPATIFRRRLAAGTCARSTLWIRICLTRNSDLLAVHTGLQNLGAMRANEVIYGYSDRWFRTQDMGIEGRNSSAVRHFGRLSGRVGANDRLQQRMVEKIRAANRAALRNRRRSWCGWRSAAAAAGHPVRIFPLRTSYCSPLLFFCFVCCVARNRPGDIRD